MQVEPPRAFARAVLGRRMGDEYWETGIGRRGVGDEYWQTIAERQFGTKIMLHDERAKRAEERGDLALARSALADRAAANLCGDSSCRAA